MTGDDGRQRVDDDVDGDDGDDDNDVNVDVDGGFGDNSSSCSANGGDLAAIAAASTRTTAAYVDDVGDELTTLSQSPTAVTTLLMGRYDDNDNDDADDADDADDRRRRDSDEERRPIGVKHHAHNDCNDGPDGNGDDTASAANEDCDDDAANASTPSSSDSSSLAIGASATLLHRTTATQRQKQQKHQSNAAGTNDNAPKRNVVQRRYGECMAHAMTR